MKRATERERVTVRVAPEERQAMLRDELRRDDVVVTRVPAGREVAEAPAVRVEDDTTIIPVLEERLVVERRLFLVEELHLRRTATTEAVEIPVTLRSTRVEIERNDLNAETD